jgi:hypothetical protein
MVREVGVAVMNSRRVRDSNPAPRAAIVQTTASIDHLTIKLLECDHAEQSVQTFLRSRRKVELILLPVGCCPTAKVDCPKLTDLNRFVRGVHNGPHKLSSREIEAVDGASVGVVGNQKSIAQRTEVLRSHDKSPRPIQWVPMSKLLHECAALRKDVWE